MACLFRSVRSGNTKAFISEKTLKKSEYLVGTLVEASFYFKAAIQASYKEWIVIPNSKAFTAVMCTTNVFDSTFDAALTNSFISISSISLVVGIASAAIYKL